MERIEDVLRDNFRLKQEIACEKKRYVDLMNAFLEVRHEQKVSHTEISDSSTFFEQADPVSDGRASGVKLRDSNVPQKWQAEKSKMQETIIALSQEVEYLSTKNIEFLQDLKKRDSFYSTYRETMDELGKLREAHGILISMIKNHHIQIEDKYPPSPKPQPTNSTRLSSLISCGGQPSDLQQVSLSSRSSILE